MNDYDVWNINNDLNREFLTQVVELQPAYLSSTSSPTCTSGSCG